MKKAKDFGPVDSERYARLCAIGTHATPNEINGHYTGKGIPIPGMVIQPAGDFVAINEQ